MIKRISDILIALIAIGILLIPCIFIWFGVKLTSSGPGIYWSQRAGRNGNFFMMPKFRTMLIDTPEIETDKLSYAKQYITSIGHFLRKTSLDELPQFISVLSGEMSIVGPRPALYNQNNLIQKRKELGIDILRPGITGWAQIKGRDEITLSKKIRLDQEYLEHQSLLFDFKIILKTIFLVLKSKHITH